MKTRFNLLTRRELIFLLLISVLLFGVIDLNIAQINNYNTYLTHQWNFKDGTANDLIGNADGILQGGAVITNGALNISSQGQYFELPGDSIHISNYSELTMEIWYTSSKGINSGKNSMICYFGDIVSTVGPNGCFIQPSSVNKISRTAISCGNTSEPWLNENFINSTEEYDDGLLHQMVTTINDMNISYYIDGVLIGSAPLSSYNKLANLSNKYAFLAKSGYSNDYTWIGEIHKFSLFNKALTNNEIQLLYNVPQITNVSPSYGSYQKQSKIILSGINFKENGYILINNTKIIPTTIKSDTVIFFLPNDLNIGSYDLIYVNPDSITDVYHNFEIKPYSSFLTHQWTFENKNTKDRIGNLYGKLHGGATIENGILKTSGANQYFELPGDSINISNYSELTMDIWITPQNNANSGKFTMICYFGDTLGTVGINGCLIQPTSPRDNASRTAISCGNLTEPYLTENYVNSTHEYDDNIIHHMVTTINNTDISFFIDGNFIGKSELTNSNKISNLSNKYAYLAKSGYSVDAPWIGSIYKFSLYNKALSNDDILNIYNNDIPKQIKGIQRISPNIAVNYEKHTIIDISAFPISDNSSVKLINGKEIIKADSILKLTKYNVKALFSLSNKALGLYDLIIISPNNDTLRKEKCFSLQEVGTKFGEWSNVEIPAGKTKISSVQIPQCKRLYAFLKKSSRTGDANSTTTWKGEIRVYKDGKLVSKASDSQVQQWWVSHPYMVDYETEIDSAEADVYTFEIENYELNELAKAEVLFTDQPPTLELNKWGIGEILRPFGIEWKKITVPANTKRLIFKTEGAGYACQLIVKKGSIMSPQKQWLFINKEAWSGVTEGEISNPESGDYFLEYKESSLVSTSDQQKEVMFYVGTEQAPILQRTLSIESLSTYNVGQGNVTIDITGTGFSASDTVKLVKGKNIYIAQSLFKDERNLSAAFDLTSADTGKYELIICDSKIDTIVASSKEVNVEGTNSANNLWVEILSRDKIRKGFKQKLIIRYGNKGNVDFDGALLYIEASKDIIDSVYSQYIYDYTGSNYIKRNITYFNIPVIPAQSQNEMELSLLSNSDDLLEFEAGFINYNEAYISNTTSSLKSLNIRNYLTESYLQSNTDQPKAGDLVFEMYGAVVHVGIVKDQISNGNNIQMVSELAIDGNVHESRTLSDFTQSDTYLGYGNFGDYTPDQINKINSITDQSYQEHQVGKDPEYIYSIWLPTPNSLKDNINPENRTFGHCGSYVNDVLRKAGIIKPNDEINFKNPANYPYKTLDYLKTKGKFHPSPNYKDGDNKYPLRIPVDYMNHVLFDEYDKFYKNLRDLVKRKSITPVNSVDPSDKYCFSGTTVVQDGKTTTYLDSLQTLKYRIDFWNKETATAPVLTATVKDTLDTDMDISTFNFTEAGYKNWKVKLDGGRYFNITIDCRPSMPYYLNIWGDVDSTSRVATITYTTLDTLSLKMPENPMAGYMPAITSVGDEISWVSYSIDPGKKATEKTEFTNKAWIEFDNTYKWEDAPHGKPATSQYDLSAPASKVLELPSTINVDTVLVLWQGADPGCGLIASYDIYVSSNGSDYTKWQTNTSTQAVFKGEFGKTYSFYSIAKDVIGNSEPTKQKAEASVKMEKQGTGINNISNSGKNSMIVYPNPSTESKGIKVSIEAESPKNKELVISSVYGSTEKTIPFTGNELEVKGLNNGMYIFTLRMDSHNVISKKVVITQ